MLLGFRLFKWCRNLPAGALCCRGVGFLNGVGNYLLGTVLQVCRLFKWYENLPSGHCVAEVNC